MSKTEYKIALFCFIFLLIVINFVVLYDSVLKPSYLSVQSACGSISDEELSDMGYMVVGSYYPSPSDSINITIYGNDEDREIWKHEYCHHSQAINKRAGDCCSNKLLKFINEVECNIAEELPDFLYNKIYK